MGFAERLLGPAAQAPPPPTLGAIARAHGAALRRDSLLEPQQLKALAAVATCRTSVLGGRVDACPKCAREHVVFHSCRNRHCPQCQSLSQTRWMEHRLSRLLPTPYFHVVFTVPDDLLVPIALRNREIFFDALFASGSETLLALGEDPERLGAQLGLTAVLHTWTRDLRFHPHLHCIVTGGGLSRTAHEWHSTRQKFLFPVKVISKLFRGKFLAALTAAFRAGKLNLRGIPGFERPSTASAAWQELLDLAYAKKWVSYAKRPFGGAAQVYEYLGQYTHRVGISNHRILHADDDRVTIRTRGEQTASMKPAELLRRFLLHVLPPGFVKLRHYGLLAPGNVNSKLVTARDILVRAQPHPKAKRAPPEPTASPTPPALPLAREDWRALFFRRTGIDLGACPLCSARLISRALDRPLRFDSS